MLRTLARRVSQLGTLVFLGAAWMASPGCGGAAQDEVVILDDSTLATVVDTTLEMSPLVYVLGGQTLNDQCPVRRVRLNRRMPAIYVNQRPIGFC